MVISADFALMLDLVLKMLLVSGVAAEREILRRAASMAPVSIQIVEHGNVDDGRLVCEMLARDSFDFVCLDSRMARPGRVAALNSARAAKERPLTILIGAAKASTREVLTDGLDFDAVLAKPIELSEARAVFERAVRARLPNRVLVVDDSATVRSIVRKVLQASRFRLHAEEADEGIQALAQMRSGRYDIVFLDCNMPGLDGFATLREIKRSHPHIEVVMITATRDERMAERARAAGAKAFLFKPFFAKDIDEVLHSLFGLNAPRIAQPA
jgi:CheY-like chemotaxis protein